jgi:hypothetical protein
MHAEGSDVYNSKTFIESSNLLGFISYNFNNERKQC